MPGLGIAVVQEWSFMVLKVATCGCFLCTGLGQSCVLGEEDCNYDRYHLDLVQSPHIQKALNMC